MFRFLFDVIRSSSKDSVGAYSAQSAFFLTVSFIPLIMLLISVIGLFPVEETALVSYIISVFPKGVRPMVGSFFTEAYSKSGAAIISITAITTLWAASIGIHSLIKGIDRIYCGEQTRNAFVQRILSMAYTLFVMALFVICLCVFVFGNTIAERFLGIIPDYSGAALLMLGARLIIGVVILGLFFLLMYSVIPNKKLSFFSQWPGALISAVGWIIFSGLFSYYFESLSGFSYVYGSLSVMVFFMLWLFFCIYILFVGAEVNKCLETYRETKVLFGKKEK